MGKTRILDHDQVLQLQAAVTTAGIVKQRLALLSGIDAVFVANLSDDGPPNALILMDLDAMNAAGVLGDGSVPLLRWLQNAVALAGPLQEATILRQVLAQVQERTREAKTPMVSPKPPVSSPEPAAPEVPAILQDANIPIDFAVLTAIEVERKAVCAALGFTDLNRTKKKERVYWLGKLPMEGGSARTILVAQSAEMGQLGAMALAKDVASDWKPRAMLMVGIAASTQPDVKLGDVVWGRSVYYYERGKITPGGTLPEPEMIPADAGLLQHCMAVAGWNGAVLASRPDNTNAAPSVHSGVIASGEKVVAHAAARLSITAGHRKILALEMEGFGFSHAAWHHPGRIPHLVIRGISDDGSERKSDVWHSYAAAAAAGFAKHFMQDQPVEHGRVRSERPKQEAKADSEPEQAPQSRNSASSSGQARPPPAAPVETVPNRQQKEPPAPISATAAPPKAPAKGRQTSASFMAVVAVIAGYLFLQRQSEPHSEPPSQERPPEVGRQPVPRFPSERQPKSPLKSVVDLNALAPAPSPPPRSKTPATIEEVRLEHGVTPLPETVRSVPVGELRKGMFGYVDPTVFPALKKALVGRSPTGRSFELHKAVDGSVFLVGYAAKPTLDGIQRGQAVDEALFVANPAGQRMLPVSVPVTRIQRAHFAIASDSMEVLVLKLASLSDP